MSVVVHLRVTCICYVILCNMTAAVSVDVIDWNIDNHTITVVGCLQMY